MAYIDRDKAILELQAHSEKEDKKSLEMLGIGLSDAHEKYLHGAYCYIVAQQILNDLTTEDVAPVVHGYWESSDILCEEYKCSVCGCGAWYYDYSHYVSKSKYCPSCGAKMDKEN